MLGWLILEVLTFPKLFTVVEASPNSCDRGEQISLEAAGHLSLWIIQVPEISKEMEDLALDRYLHV